MVGSLDAQSELMASSVSSAFLVKAMVVDGGLPMHRRVEHHAQEGAECNTPGDQNPAHRHPPPPKKRTKET